jgi:hypothetical protein
VAEVAKDVLTVQLTEAQWVAVKKAALEQF